MDESPRLVRALERLQRQAGSDLPPYGARVGAEAEYAAAYDELVQQGIKLKLRRKYRLHP